MKLHAADAITVVELWVSLKNYIPAKDIKQAAIHFIAAIDENELVDFTLSSRDLYGNDAAFDVALSAYCEENGLVEDELTDWDE